MMEFAQYEALFHSMHPGFFERDYIRSKPADEIYEEMVLPLRDFDAAAFDLPVPQGVTYGFYHGPRETLLKAVDKVGAGWVPIFQEECRVYCGFFGGEIASFCIVEDMGAHTLGGRLLKIGGPGCVGTVPEYRRQGIGLRMVRDATEILQSEGYDLSYIHYTGVAPWYAKLGYRTVIRWSGAGILRE